ncbi:MAG TPA: flavodoxin domain-containing protein [Frankiaceae bacterium]|nr:flavodoxin domain-containing protein [Frankiaceae bacterium]
MAVLVTAASKHGATAEIGAAIARHLESLGVPSEFRAPREVFQLDAYDGIVLGSAVYAGRWLADGREFAWSWSAELRARPVWLFSSGPIGNPPEPDESVDVADVLEVTKAREHRLFGGRLDRSLLGFGERAMVRAVGAKEGDFRNWNEIAAWSTGIAEAMKDVSVRL